LAISKIGVPGVRRGDVIGCFRMPTDPTSDG
jgi:hypothetical protein